jgi:hypothetical protein
MSIWSASVDPDGTADAETVHDANVGVPSAHLVRSGDQQASFVDLLAIRRTLECDLTAIRAAVSDIRYGRDIDLHMILGSLRFRTLGSDQLWTELGLTRIRRPSGSRQKLIDWVVKSSGHDPDFVLTLAEIYARVGKVETALLDRLERAEDHIRDRMRLLDQTFLDCRPTTVEEACGLLSFVAGLLACDSMDDGFYSRLITDCVDVLSTVQVSEPGSK